MARRKTATCDWDLSSAVRRLGGRGRFSTGEYKIGASSGCFFCCFGRKWAKGKKRERSKKVQSGPLEGFFKKTSLDVFTWIIEHASEERTLFLQRPNGLEAEDGKC